MELLKRGLILGLLLTIANFTLLRHCGYGFDEIYVLSGAPAAFSVVLFAIEKLKTHKKGEVEEERRSIAKIHKGLKWLFSTPVLVTLGACILLFASTVSSVIVSGEFPDKEQDPVFLFHPNQPNSGIQAQDPDLPDLDAQIRTAKCTEGPAKGPSTFSLEGSSNRTRIREQWRSKDDPYRFIVTTNPFGATFELKVTGYLSRTIDVYPLSGIRLNSNLDLQRAPSLLFRPDVDSLADIENGGYAVISVITSGKPKLLACIPAARKSYLIGSMDTLPTTDVGRLLDAWKLELQAANEDQRTTAETLVNWKDPVKLELPAGVDIVPFMRVRAEVRSVNGATVAIREVTVSDASLTDIALSYSHDKNPAAHRKKGQT